MYNLLLYFFFFIILGQKNPHHQMTNYQKHLLFIMEHKVNINININKYI